MIDQQVRAGTLADLESEGRLLTKVGSVPVVVFWHDGAAYAIEDRCPHLGFPLHQGTVEAGLVTCHWHHARFDLVSGCTLDPWADDARGFAAEIRDGDVFVDRARRLRPDRAPARPAAQRPRGRHHPGDRQVGARPARRGRSPRRHRAHRGRLRHDLPRRRMGRGPDRARRDGQPLPPPRRRRPRARARARMQLRRERHGQPGAAFPRRSVADASGADAATRRVVPPVRRDPLPRLRRTHARDRARPTRPTSRRSKQRCSRP